MKDTPAAAFWREPKVDVDANIAKGDLFYAKPEWYDGLYQITEHVIELLETQCHIGPNTRILELGPNSGRNMQGLWDKGYKFLSGIEIQREAWLFSKRVHPDISRSIINNSIENVLPSFHSHDVIFTQGVLMHISPASADLVFHHIARVAWRYLLTIEQERKTKGVFQAHKWGRNYQEVFESRGFSQVYVERSTRQGNAGSICRVFLKGATIGDPEEEFGASRQRLVPAGI